MRIFSYFITDPAGSTLQENALNYPHALNLATFLTFAFTANLPLGFLRAPARKFSLRWFVYIHLSIPFIIVVRLSYGLGWSVVPFSILCAVAGQILGARFYRRTRQ